MDVPNLNALSISLVENGFMVVTYPYNTVCTVELLHVSSNLPWHPACRLLYVHSVDDKNKSYFPARDCVKVAILLTRLKDPNYVLLDEEKMTLYQAMVLDARYPVQRADKSGLFQMLFNIIDYTDYDDRFCDLDGLVDKYTRLTKTGYDWIMAMLYIIQKYPDYVTKNGHHMQYFYRSMRIDSQSEEAFAFVEFEIKNRDYVDSIASDMVTKIIAVDYKWK